MFEEIAQRTLQITVENVKIFFGLIVFFFFVLAIAVLLVVSVGRVVINIADILQDIFTGDAWKNPNFQDSDRKEKNEPPP